MRRYQVEAAATRDLIGSCGAGEEVHRRAGAEGGDGGGGKAPTGGGGDLEEEGE
jgi:hypothetical protein